MTRVRLSRRRGARLPEGTIVVSRPTKWGNPFVVGPEGSRARCYELFVRLMHGHLCISCDADPEVLRAYAAMVRRDIGELRGRPLACWCPLPAPGEVDQCHAAVLLALANPLSASDL